MCMVGPVARALVRWSVRMCNVTALLVRPRRHQQPGAVENENHVPHAVERRGQGGR